MKQFRVLLMLLMLVTFSTGFGKTTADLKQNSKTELVVFDMVKDYATISVNVVSFDFVNSASKQSSGYTTVKGVKTNYENFEAIITDVGWQYSQRNYKQLATSEKVMSFKDLYHKNKLKTNRIRDDNTFINSLPFTITNWMV